MLTIEFPPPFCFNQIKVGETFTWFKDDVSLSLIKIAAVTGNDAFVQDYNAVELKNGCLHHVPGLDIIKPFNATLKHV
jgi:hypothetical protein